MMMESEKVELEEELNDKLEKVGSNKDGYWKVK